MVHVFWSDGVTNRFTFGQLIAYDKIIAYSKKFTCYKKSDSVMLALFTFRFYNDIYQLQSYF